MPHEWKWNEIHRILVLLKIFEYLRCEKSMWNNMIPINLNTMCACYWKFNRMNVKVRKKNRHEKTL